MEKVSRGREAITPQSFKKDNFKTMKDNIIDALQKLLPWAAGLPLAPKIMISIIVLSFATLILLLIWTPSEQQTTSDRTESNKDIFKQATSSADKPDDSKPNYLNITISPKDKPNIESKIESLYTHAKALSLSYERDSEIKKIIDYCMRHNRPDLAIIYVDDLSLSLDRDSNYKKLLKHYIDTNQFSKAEKIVKNLTLSMDRDNYRKKIIDAQMKRKSEEKPSNNSVE
jgi:hypothetical protein